MHFLTLAAELRCGDRFFLWLSGHIAAAVAALRWAGANSEGEVESDPGNEKCARRAHFFELQNG